MFPISKLAFMVIGCSMISGTPTRPWLLSNELSGEVYLDRARNSCMVKVGWHCLYQGLLLPPQAGEQELISHPLTALERYLPEL